MTMCPVERSAPRMRHRSQDADTGTGHADGHRPRAGQVGWPCGAGRVGAAPQELVGQLGATARPVVGEIMPAHRPRLASVWAMRGIAALVLAGHSCIRMICPLVSRVLAATIASTLAPFQSPESTSQMIWRKPYFASTCCSVPLVSPYGGRNNLGVPPP